MTSYRLISFGLTIIFILISQAAPLYAAALRIENSGLVFDQAGRKIEIKHPFTRIISLYGAHTENLFDLGLKHQLIGVSRNEAYPPEALKKPVFSYHDDPEKFLAARPDLVLIRPMIDRGYARLLRRLEQSGITVVSIQPRTIEEMYRYWEALGLLVGKHHKARRMIDTFQTAVLRFRKLADQAEPKKRVYFEAMHKKMKTFTPDAMAIFALRTAGGINLASGAQSIRGTNIASFGKERILALAEQIDIYLAQYGAMNRPTKALIRNEPGFRIIKAIREDQIFLIDEMIVSRPTMRLIKGIFTIGQILYPTIFNEQARSLVQEALAYR
ncbi:MAG: ABC transporter substrate-binding protein [Desulfobacterales bacterium]